MTAHRIGMTQAVGWDVWRALGREACGAARAPSLWAASYESAEGEE